MRIVEELVEYFSELLSEGQKKAVGELLGAKLRRGYDVDDREDFDDFDEHDKYDEYEECGFAVPDRRSGHAAGKRRPLRRPETTAAELAAIFRKMVREWGGEIGMPGLPDLLSALAAKVAPVRPAGKSRMSIWRRFTLMVAALKDLDEDALSEALAALIAERRQQEWYAPKDMFVELFKCGFCGDFGGLAKAFCAQQVHGKAAKAVLAELRNSVYPERPQRTGNTNLSTVFLRNRDIVTIFNFYRLQRKLEYIISQTVNEAIERLKKR